MPSESRLRPLIVGEVLFDEFPSGQRVLGGAPFNVAWNLQGLGAQPLFLSAVGSDAAGGEVRDRMQQWGLDTSALQTDPEHPTGLVKVEIVDDEPQYEIVPDRAFDFVEVPDREISREQFALLYHGSLACRNEVTRSTIDQLRRTSDLPAFVDINIRRPWFDEAWIPRLLADAEWVKVNQDELHQLTGMAANSASEINSAAQRLQSTHSCGHVYVTCGSEGLYYVDPDGQDLFQKADEPEPFVDSVGAGDAFASVLVLGILRGEDVNAILPKAAAYAARVCSLRGATTADPQFYDV